MPDPLKKVQPGERLQISAEAYNAFVDAARAARERQLFGTEASQFFRQTSIVKLQNFSGSDQGRFAILGLEGPIITPRMNEHEFKNQVTFVGVTPNANVHAGRFAILLEPIKNNRIGRAIISGATPVKLLVDVNQPYECAEIIDGDTLRLRNQPHGSARVLWVDLSLASGGPIQERWAIVRLDAGDFEAIVLITSNVPDADGYFPGIVQRYDVVTQSWESLFPCKVLDANR